MLNIITTGVFREGLGPPLKCMVGTRYV